MYGVALVGLGINLIAEATIIKAGGPEVFEFAHAARWFWIGLFGLAAVNAGICFIADAVKQRIYLEMQSGEAPLSKKQQDIGEVG